MLVFSWKRQNYRTMHKMQAVVKSLGIYSDGHLSSRQSLANLEGVVLCCVDGSGPVRIRLHLTRSTRRLKGDHSAAADSRRRARAVAPPPLGLLHSGQPFELATICFERLSFYFVFLSYRCHIAIGNKLLEPFQCS